MYVFSCARLDGCNTQCMDQNTKLSVGDETQTRIYRAPDPMPPRMARMLYALGNLEGLDFQQKVRVCEFILDPREKF